MIFGAYLLIALYLRKMTSANGMFQYNVMIGDMTLDVWVQETHRMMCKEYKWALNPLKPGCFGYDNLAVSIGYCYHKFLDAIERRNVSIEEASDWIHQGWIENYVYWRDQQPWKAKTQAYLKPAKPLGDERRDQCAASTYANLPEEEKQKDRLIATYFLSNLKW
jgi:hypothetical protein